MGFVVGEKRRLLMAALSVAPSLLGCGEESEEPARPPEREGCTESVRLLENPVDAAARGPWPVGARLATIEGLAAEVWYPAEIGSERGLEPKVYDVRDWLPEPEREKIPDSDNPWQVSTVYADLPLDRRHGPYPTVVFVHGTAGWRTQSLALLEHWASRGFVVVAADHPGLFLGDMLSLNLQRDLEGDLAKITNAIRAPSGDLDFMAGHVDAQIGMVGHSAGGGAIENQGNGSGVRVLIPLAARGSLPGSSLVSTLVMGGTADAVVDYAEQVAGYDSSPTAKRLVGIANAGHLFPTDLCHLKNASGEDLVTIAQEYQVQNAQFATMLFDCPSTEPPAERNRALVGAATAIVLEETLLCDSRLGFDGFTSEFPEVSELREEL